MKAYSRRNVRLSSGRGKSELGDGIGEIFENAEVT